MFNALSIPRFSLLIADSNAYLLLNVPQRSVLGIDNAPYHNVEI